MKRILFAALIILISVSAFALEVDTDEIRSPEIVFRNYAGTAHKPDPFNEIREIGIILARGVKKSGDNTLFRYHMKYSIYRATGTDEEGKLAADILSIDQGASIDHIKNVRRIIASYIKNMYGYSDAEARSIALYTTYYNAVHRSDMEYFSGKYRKAVLSRITKENAGIARAWDQWPGKTKILIPLTADKKRGKGIDPFAISDKDTRDAVNRDGKIPERKEMVDLRKKAIEDEKKAIDKTKKNLEGKEQSLKTREKQTAEKRENLEDKKNTIEKKKENLKKDEERAKTITDPEKKKETAERISRDKQIIEKQEQQVKEEEKKQNADEQNLDAEKQKTGKQKQEVTKQEDQLREKKRETLEEEKKLQDDKNKGTTGTKAEGTSETKTVTEEIKKLDEREKNLDRREEKMRQEAQEENLFASKLYYLKVMEYLEGGHYNNDLYMINPAIKKVLFKSTVTNICGSRYDIFADGIVVITHRGSHTTGHRLTIIDRNTLQALRTGEDSVFWRSFIEIRDGYIYAITWDNGVHYLARFDRDLRMVAKSKEKVSENTFITFFENYIYINREDKQVMVLSKDKLELVDLIKP